jgi:hypothetical protein
VSVIVPSTAMQPAFAIAWSLMLKSNCTTPAALRIASEIQTPAIVCASYATPFSA